MEQHKTYYVGIDISSETFTSSIGTGDQGWSVLGKAETFANTQEGNKDYLKWLAQQDVKPGNSVICMENTGVYSEQIAYFLLSQGFQICIETPLKVKRSFKIDGHKTDPVDSRQIAEYAYRFYDELRIWKPRREVLEQVKILLATREQLVVEKTGHCNSLKALKRKVIRVAMAEELLETLISTLKDQIKALETEMNKIIQQEADLAQEQALLTSIPGVGKLLSAQALVLFHQMDGELSDKKMAAFIGICPYEHSSGTSMKRKARTSQHGPEVIRKLLNLAARSVCTHIPDYRQYYLRKLAEGKAKSLAINNVGNKLLSVMVAVFKSGIPYIPGYRSIHPRLLTKS
jgi:transposase